MPILPMTPKHIKPFDAFTSIDGDEMRIRDLSLSEMKKFRRAMANYELCKLMEQWIHGGKSLLLPLSLSVLTETNSPACFTKTKMMLNV
ncbi:hypothetical protein KSP40_PGU004456 [Platanthera guangdongensis]|uniref:Uncharacterized protein n=1 Tax=Platanthera guangdongensis TaxID=2320717 RepID=A0ABR2LMT1_9ASPA